MIFLAVDKYINNLHISFLAGKFDFQNFGQFEFPTQKINKSHLNLSFCFLCSGQAKYWHWQWINNSLCSGKDR